MSSSPVSSRAGERTRVLLLIKGLGLGGAENLIAEAAALWSTDRFDYRVAFLLPWKNQLVGRLDEHGVEVSCLDWRGPGSVGAISRLRRLVEEWDPHVVHSHLPVAGIFARLFAGGPKQVYTEHNIVDYYRQPTRTLNRATYGRNDAVVTVSEAVAESIARYPGPAPRVIPNGVVTTIPDAATTEAAIRDIGLDPTMPLVVHVGNIRPHKGHSLLIEAMAILSKDHPDVVAVSIGGEKHDGDLKRIRSQAAALGVRDRIRFLGRREDALAFVAAADVVVNPSDVEGLPLSILEALALARPVVATAVGGVPSVVRDGETGILVEPGDPDALARGIARALESPEAETWGAAGAQLVAERHGLGSMVEQYEELYDELAS